MSIESKRAEVIAEQAAKGLCVCGAPLGGGHHGIADAGGPGVTGYCPLDPNRPSAREERRFDAGKKVMTREQRIEIIKKRIPLFQCADGSIDELDLIEYVSRTFGLTAEEAEFETYKALGYSDDDAEWGI